MTPKSLRHPRILVACLALTLALAACAAKGSTANSTTTTNGGGTTSTSCTPGTTVVNGINTIKFCGPAKGSVTINGQTYTISGGACFNTQGQVGVNIGHEVLDGTNSDAGKALKKQYDYFGALTAATKDGTYEQSTLAGYIHGVDFTAFGKTTLSNNLQAGSFTGTTILTQTVVTGSFTCV
ncbi:MAG: hypothetical protein H0X24_02600 [Ktedonobacterales bacterium]|nr:hypothetical protein [Ktedonobacterales bacterium]